MKSTRSWLPFVALAGLALIGLLIAGSRAIAQRTFALGSPNQSAVALLKPTQQVCEGPISTPAAFQSVGIWGAAVGGPATLTVDVKDAASRGLLASGRLEATTAPAAYRARLDRTVAVRRSVSICFVGAGANSFSLLGSPAIHPSIVMSGTKPGLEFSMILVNEGDKSLLSSLGTAFTRASLFRPSWVGAWTFWVLTAALVATLGFGAVAIAAAASADDERRSAVADHDAAED